MDAVAAALNASPVPLDLAVLLLALLLDLALGEPPNRLHPTVWMGQTVSLAGRIAPGPQRSPAGQLLAGLLMALLLPAAWGALAWAIAAGLSALHPLAYLIVAAALLKTAFSVRMLRRVAARVGRLLAAGDLAAARREMSALVSRDAASLTAGQMAAAAIESVAENITDSVVAPLLAFACSDCRAPPPTAPSTPWTAWSAIMAATNIWAKPRPAWTTWPTCCPPAWRPCCCAWRLPCCRECPGAGPSP